MANNLVKGEVLLSGKTLNDNVPLFAEIFEVIFILFALKLFLGYFILYCKVNLVIIIVLILMQILPYFLFIELRNTLLISFIQTWIISSCFLVINFTRNNNI